MLINECKDKETKNGVATLMRLPKGRVWKLEPLSSYKNAPRQGVCIALDDRGISFDSPCFLNRAIPK